MGKKGQPAAPPERHLPRSSGIEVVLAVQATHPPKSIEVPQPPRTRLATLREANTSSDNTSESETNSGSSSSAEPPLTEMSHDIVGQTSRPPTSNTLVENVGPLVDKELHNLELEHTSVDIGAKEVTNSDMDYLKVSIDQISQQLI